jgi:hypothetical protein
MLDSMIEQTTLLRLARDYADRKMRERPSLKAVLLTGSVARAEPALGDAVDLDVILIDDFVPDPPHEITRLSENVFVDALFLRTADLVDRKALRTNHFMAPLLNDALILHDPRHYFDILQASIRAPYNKPDNIYARARAALAGAQQFVDRASLLKEDLPAGPPDLALLADLRRALYLSAQAVILLSGQPGDAAGSRKFMLRFEAAARRYQPDLYPLLLSALGAGQFQPAAFDSFLEAWLGLYKAASQRGAADLLIHPAKRGYYERGFRALAAEGHTLNTLWLFEHTLAACIADLPQPLPDAWLDFTRATEKHSGGAFAARLASAEQLVSLADETLIAWARSESVEW